MQPADVSQLSVALRQILSANDYVAGSLWVECVSATMTEPHRPRVKYVIGPDGSPLTIADLPAPGTKRWVIRRKAEVVAAVRGGLLSLEELNERFDLAIEDLAKPTKSTGKTISKIKG